MAENAARRTALVVTNGRIGKVWVDLINKVYFVFKNCKLITINLIASFLQKIVTFFTNMGFRRKNTALIST